MTDSEYKQQKLRVKRYLNKWQKPAGFGWFALNVEFDRERDHDEPGTLGKCWSNWQYRQGTIKFYLPVVEEQRDDELELSVIHELCHLLISPLQNFESDEFRKITEYTTSCVAEALYWAHTQVKKGKNGTKIRPSKSNGAKSVDIVEPQATPDQAEESQESQELQSRQDFPLHETGNIYTIARRESSKYPFSEFSQSYSICRKRNS